MKTDRELLELAAKAVDMDCVMTQPFIGLQVRGGNLWNPLADDGDAMRLAVDLRMDVNINDDACDVFHADGCVSEVGGESTRQVVRRAIVRAAAAVGESMK